MENFVIIFENEQAVSNQVMELYNFKNNYFQGSTVIHEILKFLSS